MSPLAFIQCAAYAYYSGELSRMQAAAAHSSTTLSGWWYLLLLIGNGCIAFGLNVVSFTANGKVGALNMTVAGEYPRNGCRRHQYTADRIPLSANIKQVLTILLAVAIFNLTITPANAAGILITILGGAWYAWVEYEEKTRRRTEKSTGTATQ